MTAEVKNYFKLHFVVFIWGFTAILGLLIKVPALEVVFYRTLLASAALFILLKYQNKSLRLSRIDLLKILGTGSIIGLHWILFFWAARVSTASVCLAGIATCSFWTSLIEPLATKRKVKIYELLLGVVVVFGLYIIFRFEFQYFLGLSLALASAMLASVFTVINGQLTHKHNQYVITFYEMFGAFILCALFLPFYHYFWDSSEPLLTLPSSLDWFYLLILSTVCTVFAFSMSVQIQQTISAFVINLTVNLEPIYGIILAFLIFGESEEMTAGFYLGTFVILLSVLSYPLINRLAKRRALQSDRLR